MDKSAMATGTYRESATIIAFPSGRRGSNSGLKSQIRSVLNFPAKPLPVADYDAWYHREAIDDEANAQSKPVN
jgi:Protein of unknown function (DUF2735)